MVHHPLPSYKAAFVNHRADGQGDPALNDAVGWVLERVGELGDIAVVAGSSDFRENRSLGKLPKGIVRVPISRGHHGAVMHPGAVLYGPDEKTLDTLDTTEARRHISRPFA
jgi:hypothetical protein